MMFALISIPDHRANEPSRRYMYFDENKVAQEEVASMVSAINALIGTEWFVRGFTPFTAANKFHAILRDPEVASP